LKPSYIKQETSPPKKTIDFNIKEKLKLEKLENLKPVKRRPKACYGEDTGVATDKCT
jgi:hypothetical protein